MIHSWVSQQIGLLNNQSKGKKMILLYRSVSVILTSLFFLISTTNHSPGQKVIIVSCIIVAAVVLNYLYIKSHNNFSEMIILVLIETIGSSFILIPTGGLKSPYVWCSLNTILITAVELDKKYSWFNLLIYLFVSIFSDYMVFNKGKVSVFELISEQSNLILSLILITAATELLSIYIKRIRAENLKFIEANKQLSEANVKIKESMDYIMKLYHTVHMFVAHRDKGNLVELIIQYIERTTKTELAIFYTLPHCGFEKVVGSKNILKDMADTFKKKVIEQWHAIEAADTPVDLDVQNKRFIAAPVKSTYKFYGVLGIETTVNKNEASYKESIEQLRFFSELSSIVFERSDLEEVNDRLLITGEQNRIANEIHDSVLQRLFSISCGIFALSKNMNVLAKDELNYELNTIRSSIDNTIKELRSIIYGMSWRKDGDNAFFTNITNYINEVKELNNVDISFSITGNHELLSLWQKKVLYRVICEATGNAVHHGEASFIKVALNIQPDQVYLIVSDNGNGFDAGKMMGTKERGLGLENMYCLVHSLNGEININSKTGEGADIKVKLPNSFKEISKGEAI